MNDLGRVLFLELYRLDTYVCAGMYMPWVRMGVLFPLYVYPLSLGFTRSSVSSLQSAFTSGGQLLNSIGSSVQGVNQASAFLHVMLYSVHQHII